MNDLAAEGNYFWQDGTNVNMSFMYVYIHVNIKPLIAIYEHSNLHIVAV